MIIVNNTIPDDVQERIRQLHEQGLGIRTIAIKTETCRPTVRKYIKTPIGGSKPR